VVVASWVAISSAVHRPFRTHYGRQPPTRKSIRFWDKKLRTRGSLLRVKSPGKTRTSEENVSRTRKAVQLSPRKSIRAAILQLRTNSTFKSARCTTQKAPHKCVQELTDSCIKTKWVSKMHKLRCRHVRKNWRVTRFHPSSVLLRRGEGPCQWSCKQVQLQNLRLSKSTYQLERRNPKMNVWAGLMHDKLTGLFFSEKTVTGHSYLDMLELYALPPIPPQTILQKWHAASFLPPC
jgi:hypothetical protein